MLKTNVMKQIRGEGLHRISCGTYSYVNDSKENQNGRTNDHDLLEDLTSLFYLCSKTFLYRDVALYFPKGAILINFSPLETDSSHPCDSFMFSFFFFVYFLCKL